MGKPHKALAAFLSLCLFGFAFEAAAATPPAKPAGPTAFKPMVVDIQELIQKSKAAQMVRRQLEAKRAEYTKEIAAGEEKLKKEKELLQRQQATLSPAALNQRERKFQKELTEFKQNYKGKVGALQASSSEAFTKIQRTILQIIANFAKQRKATMVFPRTDLLLFDKSFDATDAVLKELDKELPALKVSFVKPQAERAAATAPAHGAPAHPAPAARHK